MRWPKLLRHVPLANQYPALHGIRVLAIFFVVQFHLTAELERRGFRFTTPFALVSQRFWFPMDLFFILSGFLIGTILLHELDKRSGIRGLLRFYVRRSFRIIPLYYVVLTLIVLFPERGFLKPEQSASLWREYAYLTNYEGDREYLMPWSWSLSVEEHFYFITPLIMLLVARLKRQRSMNLIIAGLLIVPLPLRLWSFFQARTAWNVDAFFTEIYMPTHLRLDILSAGILIALLVHRSRAALQRFCDRFGGALLFAALAVSGVIASTFSLMNSWSTQNYLIGSVCAGTLTSLAFFPLLLWALHSRSRAARALGTAPMAYLAALGYGIYLVHLVVIERIVVPLTPAVLSGEVAWCAGLPVTLCLSWLLAHLLHVTVEKASLAVRDRLTVRRPAAGGPLSGSS